jgi:hypothetical protein
MSGKSEGRVDECSQIACILGDHQLEHKLRLRRRSTRVYGTTEFSEIASEICMSRIRNLRKNGECPEQKRLS